MNRRLLAWLQHGIAAILAVVFLYSGISKILGPAAFAQAIANYQILPHLLVNVVALYLPWLEVVSGAAILAPRWRLSASLMIMGMSLVFFAAVASAMLRGLDIRCGCFGEDSGAAGLPTLLIDLAVLAGSFLLVFLPTKVGKL